MKAEVNGLNEKVVKMLAERKMTVSAAESCTGGLFAALMFLHVHALVVPID